MPGRPQSAVRARGRDLRLLPRDRIEWALLATVALWSLLPLAMLFLAAPGGQAVADGRGAFTGSDGLQLPDHMQYLAWIRDAGEHVLFANRFDVVADPHLFLHPMFALSGLAWRLGASLQLSYLLWKPVAVLVLFGGFAAYVRRMVDPPAAPRSAALVLSLFFFTPVVPLIEWGDVAQAHAFPSLVIGLELFPAGLLWGVLPTAVALGLMPVFLLGIERILDRPERPGARLLLATSLAGALVSWLHPWQGLTLLIMVGGLVAWGRFAPRHLRLVAPVAGAVAPIAYYYVLSRTDSSWEFVSRPNDLPHWGLWLAIGLGPPLAAAAVGLGTRRLDTGERLLVLWVPAALALYAGLGSSYIYHAFAGLSLPLAVLAVRGARRLRLPRPVAAALLAAAVLPGIAFYVDYFADRADDHFLGRSETAALEHLDRHPRRGAVLAHVTLGRTVPAFTGRHTWVGHPTWTPDNTRREELAGALFAGRLSPQAARELVTGSGVAFLLSRCSDRHDLRRALGAVVRSVRRFGCAAVYEVGGRGTPRREE